jgi:exocyst complex component 6
MADEEAIDPAVVGGSSDEPKAEPLKSTSAGGAASDAKPSQPQQVTARARRRREEAVRRLVADVQANRKLGDGKETVSQDFIVASTVAAALERGLDRDLHSELVQEAKENSGRIGQVCHDHSDVFLASVGKVVALGGPSADLANKLLSAQEELQLKTAGPMQQSAILWEHARTSHSRARALYIMVEACQKVAMWLERARKQAALGRPRAALEAVDEARTALTAPMSNLFYGSSMDHAEALLREAAQDYEALAKKKDAGAKNVLSLEETPFGRRAILMLPKIENEVLMGARRGLNRWFLALRSGGDGAKAGRAILRRCAYSMAMGPGQLGLGGQVPPSYLWRAKVTDNLISRMNQNGRIVRAVRLGYWFERDAHKEAQRLEMITSPGMERRAEAFASAFGWYRCWEEQSSLLVDPSDYASGEGKGRKDGTQQQGIARGGRSLGFKAKTQATQSSNPGLTTASTGKTATNENEKSKWAALLTPEIFAEDCPSR